MTTRRALHPRVRVYETVRTAHLERARGMLASSTIYRHRRYDFDEAAARGLDLIQAGPIATALVLARSDVRELEINEPLMVSSLRRTALALVVVRAKAVLLRRSVSIATYAIANDDPFRPAAAPGLRGALRRLVDRRLIEFVACRLDRVVFGTPAAERLYARLAPGIAGATCVEIPALPAPCACPADPARDPDCVLFVGAFDERKGISTLLAAWPAVVERRPSARLILVGKGQLLEHVEDFAAGRADVTVVIDPPRAEIHRLMRGGALVVLLSQRTARWREQVGLPLVEGLSHGCSVLASSETGLSPWLIEHGHGVLDPAAGPDLVAAAIADLLVARRPPRAVLSDLPSQDGRLAADAFMFPTSS